ncbi:unnamed protein product [Staurois parvus]|uniref:Uncharacterized protein n=1 Tax=Staurois parvus TaxID=386267 RepID=A0ABN9BET8_9NEOB|nr:unnamed protein product [Staurois parvus]
MFFSERVPSSFRFTRDLTQGRSHIPVSECGKCCVFR